MPDTRSHYPTHPLGQLPVVAADVEPDLLGVIEDGGDLLLGAKNRHIQEFGVQDHRGRITPELDRRLEYVAVIGSPGRAGLGEKDTFRVDRSHDQPAPDPQDQGQSPLGERDVGQLRAW
ncbi:Uncharacterised protein [Mycobacteroides abscessus]|nr:Uncharacterised protein [Mycobacteroides abscessus]